MESVTKALQNIPEIISDTVNVDLINATATFQFRETRNRPESDLKRMLSETIESLGYDSGTPELVHNSPCQENTHKDGFLHVTMSIGGMTCSHCTNTITKVLQALPSIDPDSVHVSLDQEQATMVFPEKSNRTITEASLKDTIEDLGYNVHEVIFEEREMNTDTTHDETSSVLFSLSGMTCGHCVKTVTDALRALPGVLQDSVDVSLEKRQAWFRFTSDSLTSDMIEQVVEDLGYGVTSRPHITKASTGSRLSKVSTLGSSTVYSVEKEPIQEKKKVVMRVLGMTCHSCVMSVTDALKNELPDVEPNSVYVNLQTEMAMFICAKPDKDQIQTVVEDRGFIVENIQIIQNLIPPAPVVATNSDTMDSKGSVLSLGSVLVDELSQSTVTKVTFQISGMTCSSCVRTIERGLEKLPGVDTATVQVNLLTQTGTFSAKNVSLDEKTVTKAINDLGYTASKVVFTTQEKPVSNKDTVSQSGYRAEMIITGMYCPKCIEKVHSSLIKLYGIKTDSIQIDLENGHTSFEFTGEFITRQRIRQAIIQLGFSAESITITKISGTSPDTNTVTDQKDIVSTHLVVTGMTCSSCVANIERTLMKLNGVISCHVNLLAKSAVIQHNPDTIGARSLAQMVEQIGYKAELAQNAHGETLEEQRVSMKEAMDREIHELRSRFLWSLLFAIPVILIAMIFLMALPSFNHIRMSLMKEITHGLTVADLVLFLLATPVQFWLGKSFYVKAYKSLVYARTANMETLVAMGTSVAYIASVASVIAAMVRPSSGSMSMNYFETSVLLITFIHLGKWLEALAKGKTAETITKLMDLQPEKAILVEITEKASDKQDPEQSQFIEKEIACKDIQGALFYFFII